MGTTAALRPGQLRRFLLLAEATAIAAGRLVRAAHRKLRPAQIRRKGAGDFVTAIDLRAERKVRALLQAGAPGTGFLGEESTGDDLDADFVWVVDPIDGTSNFANGLPHYAVSIALLHEGQPVVAALWCEPEQCLYSAALGRGARRNGKRVQLPVGRWDDSSILGCQWLRGQQDMRFVEKLQRHGGRIRTFGCTVVQLTDVVMGRLDANVQQQGRIWDIAAAGLVVLEAGGAFTDWDGREVFPFPRLSIGHTPTIAASKHVHRPVRRLLERK